MDTRGAWGTGLALALVAGGCTKAIEEGPKIGEIAAREEQAAPELPFEKTAPVAPDASRALENYEKLLDLPQDPVSRAETMRRLADLQLELDESGASATLAESDARLRRSIALYNTVLKEQPANPENDRVLYQLARAYQNLGETQQAEAALLKLTRDYPQSAYGDDAHFRRAELLFKLGQFDAASAEYRHVLAKKDGTPFYEAAQYKYGWSEYRQANYETSLQIFLTILNRELPPGPLVDPQAALEQVSRGKKDMAQDALRVASLSLLQMGAADAANRYFAKHGEPPFVALIYVTLGQHLLEKKRYDDSAKAYESFIAAHPRHALTPDFLTRAIAAQEQGGLAEPIVRAKERYVRELDPGAPFWSGRAPTPEVTRALRTHLEDLARFYQARGQKPRDAGAPPARTDFQAATKWYGRLLELYPQDPHAAELRFLMAEALHDAGDFMAAAAEFSKVVAEHPTYAKAPDAAFAALLAYQRNAKEAPDDKRTAALRQSVQASLALADRYPRHPQALAALTRAAEDLYQIKAWDEATRTAERVLKHEPPAPEELRRTAWSVVADAHLSQKRFPQAEAGYVELLRLTPPSSIERGPIGERLASSIYKQAEAARAANDHKTAAAAFLRVGRLVPAASIRAAADYDAATSLILLKDWAQAALALEAFRTAHPASPLLPEVDKKLAVVYESAGKPAAAAQVLQRIAARGAETGDSRRDAAWLAVALLDQARDPRAAAEYEAYVKQYPQPLDRALEARQKLADFALAKNDAARRAHWLREIVKADAAAGAQRTPRTKQLAAQAQLEFARVDAQKAAKLPLKLPLKTSLPAKKAAMEAAIAALNTAADYGVAEVTTAATYELGLLYQNLSQALLASERPARMGALEREQYDLLLEEQAFPFEEKAIQWHEANVQRVTQGLYTPWIGKSLQALAQLAPGKYGKREQAAEVYDAR